MNQNNNHATIRGHAILHSTLRRDWVCGTCGSPLVTKWTGEGWRTLCAADASHDDQRFIHSGTWTYLESKRAMATARAADVFAHLPPQMQAGILENERRENDGNQGTD
jgi:hypothetical protein